MPGWVELLWQDILEAMVGMNAANFAQTSFFGMWLVILFMPLIGIDRRDPIAGLVFALYCMGSGAALVYALPQDLMPIPDTQTMNTAIGCMGLAAGVRWINGITKKSDIPGDKGA